MRNLSADLRRAAGHKPTALTLVKYYFADRGFRAVALYRFANWLFRKRIPLIPLLITAHSVSKTGAEILAAAQIGPGLVIKHPVGVVIGYNTVIGNDCTLLQGVTLGERYSADGSHTYPTLGNNVTVCAGAKVLGKITVGDNVLIGANSVVNKDVPAGTRVAGIPAHTIVTK